MKEIIYVYTTETYKNKKWYKIGMTNQESGSVRISQQDGTSNPEKLEKQYEVNLFGETELTAYEVEQKIHRFYERIGKRVRDNREWFEVDGGIDEIKKVIESILDNSDLHKSEIKLKTHQVQSNNKINECFNSDDKLQRWSYLKTINKLERMCSDSMIDLVKVSPRYTNQIYSKCGSCDKKSRVKEDFNCTSCGYEIDADINAAINIHNRGVYSLSN